MPRSRSETTLATCKPSRRTMSSVASVEAPSITMCSMSTWSCVATDRSVSAMVLSLLYETVITEIFIAYPGMWLELGCTTGLVASAQDRDQMITCNSRPRWIGAVWYRASPTAATRDPSGKRGRPLGGKYSSSASLGRNLGVPPQSAKHCSRLFLVPTAR